MNEEIKKYIKRIARKGGKATRDKYGKEHYQRIQKISTERQNESRKLKVFSHSETNIIKINK